MSTNKIIGIVLIIGSLVLGYIGIDYVTSSEASVNIVGVEIEASDESRKQQGFIYIGLAVVLFAGGVYILNKK